MGGNLFGFHSGYQLANQTDICIIKNLGIRMTVHGCQMHDYITFTHKGAQFVLTLKIKIFKGDTKEFVRGQTKYIIEMSPYKTRLARYANSYHKIICFLK